MKIQLSRVYTKQVVTFAPGGLELGSLRDPSDKADQAAKRRSRVMNGGAWPQVVKNQDANSQTDPQLKMLF